MIKLFGKRNKDDLENQYTDIDVIQDVKPPFSWRVFVDEKIVDNWKKFKKLLDERGVTFLLTSPFTYRNRLVFKLVLIGLGVLIGVIPRLQEIANTQKQLNNQSAIHAVKDRRLSMGSATIRALASSHENNQHIVVFAIEGSTVNGVSSNTEDYEVVLFPSVGVSDHETMKYRYGIVPVDASKRLLVLYVDTREQQDDSGTYGILVKQKTNITNPDNQIKLSYPMEIVLTKSQQTTDVYRDGVIRLAALSNTLNESTQEDKRIEETLKKMERTLSVYKINEDRLTQQGIVVKPTSAQLKSFTEKNQVLTNINDSSTTSDVLNIKQTELNLKSVPNLLVSMTLNGQTYSNADTGTLQPNTVQAKELPELVKAVTDIQTAVNNTNQARITKIKELQSLIFSLNKELNIENLKDAGNVKLYQAE